MIMSRRCQEHDRSGHLSTFGRGHPFETNETRLHQSPLPVLWMEQGILRE